MDKPYPRYRTPAPVYEDFKPNSEWTHDHESYLLVIHLPGFTKEHLRIMVTNPDTLTVRGDRLIAGNKRSRFLEEFKIPDDAEASSISAKFDASFLRIRFPLRKNVKEPNQSEVGKSMSREVSAVDPDSGSSSLCSACRLPIFSTPSIPVSHGGESLFVHERCSLSPLHLQHELHPEHDLVLLDQLGSQTPATNSTATCCNCREICGTMLYQCPDMECDFQLDLLCALQIKIVHRSHDHSMTAVRLRDFAPLTCNACDTKHEAPSSSKAADTTESESAVVTTMSYLCSLCGFWVHPDCASLPNAILHYQDHKHSLFLTYNLRISADSKCFICSGVPKRTSGLYFCLKCPEYLVHIRCALTRPDTFKPVFIRDALVTDLGRLPLANEKKSLIPYFREHAAATSTNSDDHQQNLHSHPLIFHNSDDVGGGSSQSSRICNACVQFISPPFFSCSQCPDFFLHSCCANLPTQIQHRVHEHPLSLYSKAPKSDISAGFVCKGCGLWCNGFAYTCQVCDDFSMDVVCALINPAITHESHDKTHILFMSRDTDFGSDRMCNCCNSILSGICYECSICRNFKLHVRCALMSYTVRHVFDQHPLQLTSKKSTIVDIDDLCEICEEHLVKGHWFYSCGECDQSFHVDCIPSVDRLSRMKLGSTVRVEGHGCPVALVRQDDGVCGGRHCGFCGEILKFSDDGGLAYECCKCFFGVHHKCVEKYLLES